jgi:excisionase family DNA binding protein
VEFPSGKRITLTPILVTALREAADQVARGAQRVRVVDIDRRLTPREAAELIGVSRPHLHLLLDRENVPVEMVGSHHRVRAADVLAMKQRIDARIPIAFDEMFAITEDTGLYERELRERSDTD